MHSASADGLQAPEVLGQYGGQRYCRVAEGQLGAAGCCKKATLTTYINLQGSTFYPVNGYNRLTRLVTTQKKTEIQTAYKGVPVQDAVFVHTLQNGTRRSREKTNTFRPRDCIAV